MKSKAKPSAALPGLSRRARVFLVILLALIFAAGAYGFGVNALVRHSTEKYILDPEQIERDLPDADCILVLGCEVKEDGTPSDMLADRLRRSVELYRAYPADEAPRILMSGDHTEESYNEVDPMKQYAVDCGVPSWNVFKDPFGICTYESVCRLKEIYHVKKVIIITQEYHLYRAIYVARQLGIEAYGVPADYHRYRGQFYRECREILARNKDFLWAVAKRPTASPGQPISLDGNGDE